MKNYNGILEDLNALINAAIEELDRNHTVTAKQLLKDAKQGIEINLK